MSQASPGTAACASCQAHVNTPPAKAGGFELRLKAGSIGHAADYRRYTTVKSSSGSGGV
jgi:hypothetical protein